jgi:hypothetical protein
MMTFKPIVDIQAGVGLGFEVELMCEAAPAASMLPAAAN